MVNAVPNGSGVIPYNDQCLYSGSGQNSIYGQCLLKHSGSGQTVYTWPMIDKAGVAKLINVKINIQGLV